MSDGRWLWQCCTASVMASDKSKVDKKCSPHPGQCSVTNSSVTKRVIYSRGYSGRYTLFFFLHFVICDGDMKLEVEQSIDPKYFLYVSEKGHLRRLYNRASKPLTTAWPQGPEMFVFISRHWIQSRGLVFCWWLLKRRDLASGRT